MDFESSTIADDDFYQQYRFILGKELEVSKKISMIISSNEKNFQVNKERLISEYDEGKINFLEYQANIAKVGEVKI